MRGRWIRFSYLSRQVGPIRLSSETVSTTGSQDDGLTAAKSGNSSHKTACPETVIHGVR